MAAKKITFDLMNLGYPVHSDPYEHPVDAGEIDKSSPAQKVKAVIVNDKDLRRKLRKEVVQILPEIFLKNPDSSDDSDDIDFPESLHDRARRLSFLRRRKLHYTEFTTVALARRLIREEFANFSESMDGEDLRFETATSDEGCPPCEESTDTFPVIQYFRSTLLSHVSDESIVKAEPEPGFDPTHPCFQTLTGQNRDDYKPDPDSVGPESAPGWEPTAPSNLDTPEDLFPAFATLHKTSIIEENQTMPNSVSSMAGIRSSHPKFTRVQEGDNTFDIVMRQLPSMIESKIDGKPKNKPPSKDNVLKSSSRVNSL